MAPTPPSPSAGDSRIARACVACQRSKTRCIWPGLPGAGDCQRCARSGRECTTSEPGVRRRRGPSTRVGQLEEKLDGIMSLLNASRHIQNESSNSPVGVQQDIPEPPPRLPPINPQSYDTVNNGRLGPSRTDLSAPRARDGSWSQPTPDTPASSWAQGTSSTSQLIEIIPGFDLTLDEAGRVMEVYREQYQPNFPFVPLRKSSEPYAFSVSAPLLFRTIMHVVAPQSLRSQLEFRPWFLDQLANRVIKSQEKHLELLQAMLVYIAWGDFHFYVEPTGVSLLQLIVGQVVELDLHRSPRVHTASQSSLVDEAIRQRGMKQGVPHSLNDMRAVLGVFYVTSMVVTLQRRLPLFPYSHYLSTCCAELLSSRHYESDQLLVALVRVQRLATRIYTAFPLSEEDGCRPSKYSVPVSMTLSKFRAEAEAIMKDSPPGVTEHFIFKLNYHALLTQVYEPAIFMRSLLSSHEAAEPLRRTEALWFCLESSKQFLDAYAAIPADQVSYLPVSATGFIGFAVVTATRLLLLNDPDWDGQMARKTVDFVGVADRLGNLFDEADQYSLTQEAVRKRKYADRNRPLAVVYRDKLRWIRSWYLRDLAGGAPPPLTPSTTGLNAIQAANGSGGGVERAAGFGDASQVDVNGFSPSFDPLGADIALWQAILDDNFGAVQV